LVAVIRELVLADEPQAQLQRFTEALHEVFTLEPSKKHLGPHQVGRLEPTPSLKYRGYDVMPALPT
jgi:hypothetical protein